MSFSSTPNHFRHHHNRDEVRDYRVQSPHHARHHHHHHHMDETRDYQVQRADTEAILYDSYPYYANHRHTYDGQYGNTDRTEARRVRAVEYEVYEYAPAHAVKEDVGSKFVDENINEEADQFIQIEHKKFNMSRWLSKKSG
ncbi:uncharacterized protein LOC115689965 [Syzygium oleosum]|uniref:uncharacterized protein LOC115689965 n=1 Tax=Syzygium oleosum TaxID=219896 RepID=UPI0024BB8509|nr:uncharacterized protein LOC115689965 [Syzygium oleosum]